MLSHLHINIVIYSVYSDCFAVSLSSIAEQFYKYVHCQDAVEDCLKV